MFYYIFILFFSCSILNDYICFIHVSNVFNMHVKVSLAALKGAFELNISVSFYLMMLFSQISSFNFRILLFQHQRKECQCDAICNYFDLHKYRPCLLTELPKSSLFYSSEGISRQRKQNKWHWMLHEQQTGSHELMIIIVQTKALCWRQFLDQHTMNIKSFKCTQKRATGGHLVNCSLWMKLPMQALLAYQKTNSDRQKWRSRFFESF